MADNFLTDAPSAGLGARFVGAMLTFSGDADAIASGVFQLVVSGSEGAWTGVPIVGGAGDVAAGVQRVTLANNDPAVAKLGTIDADTSALFACIAGTELQVDVVSCAIPTGAATAAKQPALGTAGTASSDVITVQGIASMTALKVDGSGVTQPVSGTVAVTGTFWQATQPVSGTFWQATQPVSGTFWQATQPVSLASPVGAGTEAAAIRVTVATDSTGVLSVDDNGGALTVDGTVAATQSGTWNVGTVTTVTTCSTVTNLSQLGGQAISMGTGARDAGTQRVTIATNDVVPVSGTVAVTGMTACNTGAVVLAAGTAEIGKLGAGTAEIGKLAAGTANIGDVDVLTIAAGTNTIGGVIAQPSTSAAYDSTTACTIKRLSGIATASGANTIITAVADKKLRILALSLLATSTTAVVLYLYNGDYMLLGDGTNKLTLDMDGVGGPAGLVLPFNQGGWFQTDTANEALAVNLGGATPVIWCVTYIEVA